VTPTGTSPGDGRRGDRSEPPPASFERVLASRRMCRDFLTTPLQPAALEPVLRAGFRGPAAGNSDALDLVVLQGADVEGYWSITLTEERRAAFPWPGLLNAPVLVVPYVAPQRYVDRYAEHDKVGTGLGAEAASWPVPYWWVDGGAAVMAMLLAAEAAGLGALFFGQFDHEAAVASWLGVPDGHRALGTVALGHPGGGRSTSASARRGRPDPVNRVHRGSWRADGASRSDQP
jgi:nitroreductase